MLCKAFKNGFCPKGQFCSYAHGDFDLRAPKFYDNEKLFRVNFPPIEEGYNYNATNEGKL